MLFLPFVTGLIGKCGVTVYPGTLPIGKDGVHYSSAGYVTLGMITATVVEEFYKAKE